MASQNSPSDQVPPAASPRDSHIDARPPPSARANKYHWPSASDTLTIKDRSSFSAMQLLGHHSRGQLIVRSAARRRYGIVSRSSVVLSEAVEGCRYRDAPLQPPLVISVPRISNFHPGVPFEASLHNSTQSI